MIYSNETPLDNRKFLALFMSFCSNSASLGTVLNCRTPVMSNTSRYRPKAKARMTGVCGSRIFNFDSKFYTKCFDYIRIPTRRIKSFVLGCTSRERVNVQATNAVMATMANRAILSMPVTLLL